MPVVIIYRKGNYKNAKHYLHVYDGKVDDILNSRKKNPILPYNWEITDMGIGRSFIKRYKKKYGI